MARHANIISYGEQDVNKLEHLRVSGIGGFDRCPKSWAARVFGETESSDSKYSIIGTSVHAVIERFLRGEVTEAAHADAESKFLACQDTPRHEVLNMWAYIERMMQSLQGYELVALEDEFTLKMPEVDVPICGHRDAVFLNRDTRTLLIVDHKTHRSWYGLDHWQHDFQPLLYTYDARRRWASVADAVRYRIGYVNLDADLEWETDPYDDDALEVVMQATWKKMQAASFLGHFPARVGEECQYCPLKVSCSEFQSTVSELRDSFVSAAAGDNPLDRYAFLQAVQGAIEQMLGELKPQVIALAAANNNVAESERATARLTQGGRRQVEARPVFLRTLQTIQSDTDAYERFVAQMNDLFTVKVTALDKLYREFPQVQPLIAPYVQHVPNAAPTLKVESKSLVRASKQKR